MNRIFLIRHAEKPDGSDQGVDQTGAADSESLSVRGWQRAGALAVFFGSTEGLPVPDRIYAAAAEKHAKTREGDVGSKSDRPSETVAPLAGKVGKNVIEKFAKGQEADLVAELKKSQGTTLVCWQHEAIPEIAKLITGNAKGIPDPWPGHRFDVVWRFVQSAGSAPWVFDQVCQRVLAGDESTAIP
jgi:broad specificity phosphatase PhoE